MAHWRDTARTPKFYMVDGRAAFPMLLFLLHIRWWTFFVAFGFSLFFSIIAYYGFTITIFCRLVRNFFAGPRKHAIPRWRAQ